MATKMSLAEQVMSGALHHFAPGIHHTIKAVQEHGVTQPGAVAEDVLHESVHDIWKLFKFGAKIVEWASIISGSLGYILGAASAVGVMELLHRLFGFGFGF